MLSRLSYANVVATIALFLALTTGGAYAASRLITGRRIAPNAIDGRKVRDGALTSRDVKDGSLLARDFKRGQLPAGAGGGAGGSGADGSNGSDGAGGTPGATGAPGAPGAPGRDGAGLVAWRDFGSPTIAPSSRWTTVGTLTWTQPANTLETIGGVFEWPRIAASKCFNDLRMLYMIVVDGRELSYDVGNDAPDGDGWQRAAAFPNLPFAPSAASDPGTFGAEIPLAPQSQDREHTLELRLQNSCNSSVTMQGLQLHVTRFVGEG